MKVLILSSRARIILKYSCSRTVVVFKSQIKNAMACVHLTWSLQRSPVIQALSGSLVARSSLLRPVPPTLALSSQRSRSVPRPVVLHVQSRTPLVPLSGPVIFPVLGRRAQTNQFCNPIPGSSLWVFALVTRPLLSCGRWFLTHWRYPQSALGRWCLWLLRPIGA